MPCFSSIRNLSVDHDKYSKSPKIARALAGYLRRFLFSYQYLYTGFEKVSLNILMKIFHCHLLIEISRFQGKDYFQRITRLLSTFTDLELLASVMGKELDADVTNRIQLNYITYLKVNFPRSMTIDHPLALITNQIEFD